LILSTDDFVHGLLKLAINLLGNLFGVPMAAGADNQPRGIEEGVAQQRLALASASTGPERAPAAILEAQKTRVGALTS
jgi:hypothetical protein